MNMQISTANIGQVICLDNRSQHIQIESVSDAMVTYLNEIGHRFGFNGHNIPGRVVEDKERIQEFRRNYELGHSLNAAESSAMRKILDDRHSEEDRAEAEQTLRSIRAQQEHLERRVEERNREEARESDHNGKDSNGRKRDSLDSMIHRAETEKETSHFGRDQQRKAPVREQQEQDEPKR